MFPRRGSTWNIDSSSGVVTEDVTIHAGGFLEQLGEGGHIYRRVKIIRRPGRLMALNADGFHSTSTGTGPTLLDPEISFTGDDHLNTLARMLVISKPLNTTASATPATSLAMLDVSGVALDPGDALSFYKLLPGKHPPRNPMLGAGLVRTSAPVTDPALIKQCHAASDAMGKPPFNA